MHNDLDDEGGTAPCFLHGDPRQALDVARWRKSERERLIAARQALPAAYRTEQAAAIGAALESLLPRSSDTIVSVYWPIRGEPDLRPWMQAQWQRGLRIALPVAVALGQPLLFREWRPDGPLARGLWKIPYPKDGMEVVPTVVLAPLVGFDAESYRLGYGGGFFDRTLAGMRVKPLVVGVGYPDASIRTIFPRPHDIPMDWIIAGANPPRRAL
jgi:5-formyltetrahydrofolate cyclo-ligase